MASKQRKAAVTTVASDVKPMATPHQPQPYTTNKGETRMPTVLDMSDVEDLAPIAAGSYFGTATEFTMGETKEHGDPKVDIKLVFSSDNDEAMTYTDPKDENAVARPIDIAGKSITWTRSLGKTSLPYWKRDMIRMGADPEDLTGKIVVEEVMQSVLHNPIVIVLEVDSSYDGEPRNKVKSIRRAV